MLFLYNCWPTTALSSAARTSISRGISPSRLPSNDAAALKSTAGAARARDTYQLLEYRDHTLLGARHGRRSQVAAIHHQRRGSLNVVVRGQLFRALHLLVYGCRIIGLGPQ